MSDPPRATIVPELFRRLAPALRTVAILALAVICLSSGSTLVSADHPAPAAVPSLGSPASFLHYLNASWWAAPVESDSGQNVNFTAAINGSSPPYVVNWTIQHVPGYFVSSRYYNLSLTAGPSGMVYNVTINVTDSTNASTTYTHPYYVAPAGAPPFGVQINCTTDIMGAPLDVKCTQNLTGFWPIVRSFWEFGDGYGQNGGGIGLHAYARNGTYQVSDQVGDAGGDFAIGTTQVTVGNISVSSFPSAVLWTNVTNGTAPLSVALRAGFQAPANSSIVVAPFALWNWTFGDGSPNAAGNAVNHTYQAGAGKNVTTYDPSISIPFGYNNTNSTTVSYTSFAVTSSPITVYSPGNGSTTGGKGNGSGNGGGTGTPPSNNSSRPMSILARLLSSVGTSTVTATFEVDVSGGTAPYRVDVDFGDGASGTYGAGASIVHTYRTAGAYRPSATVHDARGAVQTIALPTVTVSRATAVSSQGFAGATVAVYGAAAAVLALIVTAMLLVRAQHRRVRVEESEGRAIVRALEEEIRRD